MRIHAGQLQQQSIRLRIVYFNTFCLSLFYYIESVQNYTKAQLSFLYQTMTLFILQRKRYPAEHLAGLGRWSGIGPLLDPYLMQLVASFGLFHRQGLKLNQTD